MKAWGVVEVQVAVVPGETHMFDLPPTVGTTNLGSVLIAAFFKLNWLLTHA
jgi:hypothetical protein